MNADVLRQEIAAMLQDELPAHVEVQGKRIVVTDEEDVTIILVTAATRAVLARERLNRLTSQP